MTRLLIVVEGESELEFVARVLGPHLDQRGVYTTGTIVTTKHDAQTGRRHKGGGGWSDWQRDISVLLRNPRSDFRVTTMFDLYGLPRDFPDVARFAATPVKERVAGLEAAMAATIGDDRFLPYLQQHEFEALVLAGLDALIDSIDEHQRVGARELRRSIAGIPPEDVNERLELSPSHRLRRHITKYSKVVQGVDATELTGIPKLRAACPRFDAWVTQLEGLA